MMRQYTELDVKSAVELARTGCVCVCVCVCVCKKQLLVQWYAPFATLLTLCMDPYAGHKERIGKAETYFLGTAVQ